VKVLATSRENLAVEGEATLAIPPLELPDEHRAPAESEAVQLFIERAEAVRGGLDLLGRHEAAVVDVCSRLDGIPLAIELAAAQIAHFTPEEIAARLGNRFRLLAGGRRRIRRHATLQAAVDWSYQLLGEPERILLARLGVFAGDFSLAAAEGICASRNDLSQEQVPSLLASLVDKSLVVPTTHDHDTRYRLLETIRIFAEERLVERGEAAAVRGTHRDWYLGWVERLDSERATLPALRPIADLVALEMELDNLRAAFLWSEQERRPDLIGRMAAAADVLWIGHAHCEEGSRWLSTACAAPAGDPVITARCAVVDGWVTMHREDFKDVPGKMPAALEAAERAGLIADERAEAIGALVLEGLLGFDRGRQLIEHALRIAEANGLAATAVRVSAYAGMLWLQEGALDQATAVFEQLQREMDPRHPRFTDIYFLAELAQAHHLAGRHQEAILAAATAEAASGGHPDPFFKFPIRGCLAFARASGGECEGALTELLDLFERARRDRAALFPQWVLTLIAAVLALRGHDETASIVLAAKLSKYEFPFRGQGGDFALYRHYEELLRQRLGDDVAERCREAGARMSLDDAVALARKVASCKETRHSEDIPAQGGERPEAIFRQEGEYWSIAWEGHVFRLGDAKGLHYIAQLLRNPRTEFHVLDLVRGSGSENEESGTRSQGLPLLDAQAKAAYKRRLDELREELEEAERFNDASRASRARAEIEALSEQLAAAIGLGGRERLSASNADRARQAVTKRIKAALDKIGTVSPALGEHLSLAIVTGYFCAYAPRLDASIEWLF
jgi:non-specific serine/threonine protein kinase